MKKNIKMAPFRGLLYSNKKIKNISDVMAPPYDVIPPDMQERLYAKNPFNVIRLILGKKKDSDSVGENRYTRAASDLRQWIDAGVLLRDEKPAFYLYEQEFTLETGGRHKRRGFLGLRRLEEYGEGVHRHEKTMEGPKKDRFELIKNCHTNLSPIFSLYSDPKQEISKLLATEYTKKPCIDVVDEGEVAHRVWRVTQPSILKKISEKVSEKDMFIADGHHRYEIGLAYQKWMLQNNPRSSSQAPFNYIMMFCTEIHDPGLIILPTHRFVPSFNGGVDQVLADLRENFEVESFREGHRADFFKAVNSLTEEQRGFGVMLGKGDTRYHLVVVNSKDCQEQLDVQWVHDLFLKKILGFKPEDEKNQDKIKYLKNREDLLRLVDTTPDGIGILMKSTSPESLLKEVQKGTVMPPKSTYFYPKLLSGLLFRPIHLDEEV